MKNFRNNFFYVAVVGGFSALIYLIYVLGGKLEMKGSTHVVQPESGAWSDFAASFLHNLQHPLALLLAQIITIIFVARLFGWICYKNWPAYCNGRNCRRDNSWAVIIWNVPAPIIRRIIPGQFIANLQFLSQVGLILFMYIIGMELDLKLLKKQNKGSRDDQPCQYHNSLCAGYELRLFYL